MSINRLTGKQEAFCREYVRCGVAARAYRLAYKVGEKTKPETVYVHASHLLADTKIATRIADMQRDLADVAVGEIVAGYRQARDRGLELDDLGPVNTAITGLARVKGFLKDDPAKAGDIHIHFDDLLRGVL